MQGYDAREIANFFLDHAATNAESLTNLSLLKIIYYAHGWHLNLYGRPLVKNTFEAWPRGPVIRVVYDCFKNNGGKPIRNRAEKFDAEKNKYVEASLQPNESLSNFLIGIYDFYSKIDPFDLSDMTHEPNGPWDTIIKKSKENICLQLKIPDALILEHFKNKQSQMS
jgi:uncharacterized phage-associated protein